MPAIDEMLFDLLWPGCPWLFETQFEGSQKGLHAPRNVQLLCNFLPWQKRAGVASCGFMGRWLRLGHDSPVNLEEMVPEGAFAAAPAYVTIRGRRM